MTKDDGKIKDWRSTGRRKARSALFKARVMFKCVDCGRTSKEPPKDAPAWFEEIWPEENRVLEYSLQADHETKDLTHNTIDKLNWRCAPCHKAQDSKTEKGEATVKEDFWGGEAVANTENSYW
jgi:hypothetical protein